MTAVTSVHKAKLKISGTVYESRCGRAVDEPFASDDWTRVSCLKCLHSGAKHSDEVAKMLDDARSEKLITKAGRTGGFGSHRGNWGGVG